MSGTPLALPIARLSLVHETEALFFLYGVGCVACEAAAPELDRYAAETDLLVLRLNAAGDQAARLGVKITATPTYVYRRGRETVAHVGVLKATQLRRWVDLARKSLTEG